MNALKLKPKTEEEWLGLRTKDITSTDVAALFGLSPYMTEYELWHRKRGGHVVLIEDNDRMKWGRRLQDAIAKGLAEDNGWKIRPMKEYMRIPELRVGSSFDYAIGKEGILEVKNVDSLAFRDGWAVDEDGNVEAPPHVEMQVQHQLLVTGRKEAYIGALIGGNRAVPIRREADPEIGNAILEKAQTFWESVETGQEPNPDFTRDADFIARLYSQAKAGSVVDKSADKALQDLAEQHRMALEMEKKAKAMKDEMKARILLQIGDAAKVLGNGFSIATGEIAPTLVPACERAGYRNFKIYWKKGE